MYDVFYIVVYRDALNNIVRECCGIFNNTLIRMLYAQYTRSIEMRSQLGTASVKLTAAGETAPKVRHEYVIGGDTDDLLVLIDKINRKKADPSIQILPRTYTKNGRVYNSDRPGAIVMYSWTNIAFGEVHYNGEYTIRQGERAGQIVSSYKLVAPQMWLSVHNLFENKREHFNALPESMQVAYLTGTLGAKDGFTPALCDPDTKELIGAESHVDDQHDDLQDDIDGLNQGPEAPSDDADENAPF